MIMKGACPVPPDPHLDIPAAILKSSVDRTSTMRSWVPYLATAAVRSYLYVPGDRPDRLAKAGARGADALILDLEDSVAPAAKDPARRTVAHWLGQHGPGDHGPDRHGPDGHSPDRHGPDGHSPDGQGPGERSVAGQLWIRINSGEAAADIATTVSTAVTGVVVPKAEPALIAEIDELLARREHEIGVPSGRLRVLPLIETAAGLLAAVDIAAGPRVVRLGIGEADLSAELGITPGPERAELLPIRLQVVIASAAAGIAAPVAPTGTDFRDLAGLRESTRALLRLGFRARTAIHPAQLPVINEVFTPSPDEIDRAGRLVAALDAAERAGSGVTTDENGAMVDVAVARAAREILARAAQRPR
jgi:citrate lyase subunit beta/citryl-CoA lyase